MDREWLELDVVRDGLVRGWGILNKAGLHRRLSIKELDLWNGIQLSIAGILDRSGFLHIISPTFREKFMLRREPCPMDDNLLTRCKDDFIFD
jgi:hypothetical protein